MFNLLKQQAINFFSNNLEPDAVFRNYKDQKAKRKFYMLLIAHHADNPEEIINVIVMLKSNGLFE